PFFDPSIKEPKKSRTKKAAFNWIKEGTFKKKGEKLRAKVIQMELESGITSSSQTKQSDTSEAVASDESNPNMINLGVRKLLRDPPPSIEWWDERFLRTGSFEDLDTEDGLILDEITIYVEHPVPIKPA